MNGALADENAPLQRLTATPFRAPEHVLFGYRLNQCGDFRRAASTDDNVVAVGPRPLDATTQGDTLLTEHGVLALEPRLRTSEITGSADRPLSPGACRLRQASECPPEGGGQGGHRVRVDSGSVSCRC